LTTGGTTVFFSRVSVGFALIAGRAVELLVVFGVFFCAALDVRLTRGFFARAFDPADLAVADLDVAGLETLRVGGLAVAALFALGLVDFVCIERPLREVFGDDGRVGVRDLDRLMPLVTGLLIRRFRLKG
jgi:hypothetical protein